MTCVTKTHFSTFQVSRLPFTTESLSEICEIKRLHSEEVLKSRSVITLEYYCLLGVHCLFKGQGLTQYFSKMQTNKQTNMIAELVSDKKCFLLQLKKYLTDKPIYSVEEYLNAQQTCDERQNVVMFV